MAGKTYPQKGKFMAWESPQLISIDFDQRFLKP
jgi:hypothetical protein